MKRMMASVLNIVCAAGMVFAGMSLIHPKAAAADSLLCSCNDSSDCEIENATCETGASCTIAGSDCGFENCSGLCFGSE